MCDKKFVLTRDLLETAYSHYKPHFNLVSLHDGKNKYFTLLGLIELSNCMSVGVFCL